MRTKFLTLSLLGVLLLTGCSTEDEPTNSDTQISVDDTSANAALDTATDDIASIVDDQAISAEDGITNRATESFVTACAVITRTPAFGTVLTPGDEVVKTIDFGTGCVLLNGNHVTGKIIIFYTYDPSATSHTITYAFENFHHNTIKIEGSKDFTVDMRETDANPTLHPYIVMNMNMTATFLDGRVYTRVGSRETEIISGQGDTDWTNNVYQVIGSWETTLPSSMVQTATITTPLIVKLNCSNIVAGEITITRGAFSAILNYGDGTCDNVATLSYNNSSQVIVLGINN